jgi:hypothetical protein
MPHDPLAGLPPWFAAVVRFGREGVQASVSLDYSEAEDCWYASMDGPAQGEQWEVKRYPTAAAACAALMQRIGKSRLPSGKTYREYFAEYFQGDNDASG